MALAAGPMRRASNLPVRKIAITVVAIGLGFFIFDANAQMAGLNPKPDEIAQLPQFCWAQFKVPNAIGPQYKPNQCGPGTNHYCPGLLVLNRFKRQTDKSKKINLLKKAEEDVRYTENGTQSYPRCSIRKHIHATKWEVQQLMQIYGSGKGKSNQSIPSK